jgi:D-alanyl-D-alanine carboxypeptidase
MGAPRRFARQDIVSFLELFLLPRAIQVMKLLIFLLIGARVFAQTSIPDTPPGKVLGEWLNALNSGQREQVEVFQRTYAPDRADMPDRMLGMLEQSGGLDAVSVTQSETSRISVLVKQRKDGRSATITLAVTPSGPPMLAGIRVEPGVPPVSGPAIEYSKNAYEALDQEAQRTNFSGTLLVARDGKVVFQKAYGLANRQRNIPNRLDTKLQIGSMNKMFTAVAVLQLVDRGRIDLNAPISTYLPKYPNQELASKVTIRQLLTHTGGTGDIFGKEYEAARLQLREPKDFIRLFGSRGPAFEPGTRGAYSNYGFIILGNVIEAVTGVSYFDYVRRRVFDPAGMKDTDSTPETEPVANRAVGYMGPSGTLRANTDTLPWRGTPAGGGYSTVGDLFNFAQALQAGKILSAK